MVVLSQMQVHSLVLTLNEIRADLHDHYQADISKWGNANKKTVLETGTTPIGIVLQGNEDCDIDFVKHCMACNDQMADNGVGVLS
jgi:hypothetical protein